MFYFVIFLICLVRRSLIGLNAFVLTWNAQIVKLPVKAKNQLWNGITWQSHLKRKRTNYFIISPFLACFHISVCTLAFLFYGFELFSRRSLVILPSNMYQFGNTDKLSKFNVNLYTKITDYLFQVTADVLLKSSHDG